MVGFKQVLNRGFFFFSGDLGVGEGDPVFIFKYYFLMLLPYSYLIFICLFIFFFLLLFFFFFFEESSNVIKKKKKKRTSFVFTSFEACLIVCNYL